MKICLLTRFFNRRNAGIGMYSDRMLLEMIKRGHEVDPVCCGSLLGAKGYLIYTAALIKVLIPSDCDVYHSLTPMESIYLPKEKSVATFHDLMPWLHPKSQAWYMSSSIPFQLRGSFASEWFKFGCRQAIKCNTVVTTSTQNKDELKSVFFERADRVKVITPGIAVDLVPKSISNPDKTYRIGVLCYADGRKRIDILIRAYQEAEPRNSELWLACFGPSVPDLEKLANGDSRIKFLGFIDEDKKVDFFNSLDVFVFPSLMEGYGTPMVEAMACGKPVVTLDDSLIPKEVKDRTHIVSREELVRLLRSRVWVSNIEENYRYARECTWEETARQTEELYREVCRE